MGRNVTTTVVFENINPEKVRQYLLNNFQRVKEHGVHRDAETGYLRVAVYDDSDLDEAALEAVLTGFDHSLTPVQAAAAHEPAIEQSARAALDNIPAWLRKTPAQVSAYVDANVTDLASAKVAIRAMAVAVIILARLVITDYIAEKETE